MKLLRKIRLPLAVILVLVGGIYFAPSAYAADDRDCDDNAVVRCGTLSEAELQQKCRENQGDVQAIFREFSISNCDMLSGLVEGRITGDNKVFVGDKLVATDALTAGRHNLPGSTTIAGGAAFRRPPSTSFVEPGGSLRALVKMEGDTFHFAIITSCGNPVVARPFVPPTPPPPPPPVPAPVKPVTKPEAEKPKPKPRPAKPKKVVKRKPAPPLPVTGPNEVIGIFMATTIGAFGAHQLVNRAAYRFKLK